MVFYAASNNIRLEGCNLKMLRISFIKKYFSETLTISSNIEYPHIHCNVNLRVVPFAENKTNSRWNVCAAAWTHVKLFYMAFGFISFVYAHFAAVMSIDISASGVKNKRNLSVYYCWVWAFIQPRRHRIYSLYIQLATTHYTDSEKRTFAFKLCHKYIWSFVISSYGWFSINKYKQKWYLICINVRLEVYFNI